MAKHKCGTCRFYEEAGFAGSGWCHHPQRVTTTGALVMVRRNELACRDGWDRNLWEPAGQDPAEPEEGRQRIALRPLAGAESGPGRTATNRATPQGEDVLLSEARIVSDGPGTWEPPARTFPAGGFDPRTAIFRAREAYRERARAKAAAVRQATAAEALASASDPSPVPELEAVQIGAGAAFNRARVSGSADAGDSDSGDWTESQPPNREEVWAQSRPLGDRGRQTEAEQAWLVAELEPTPEELDVTGRVPALAWAPGGTPLPVADTAAKPSAAPPPAAVIEREPESARAALPQWFRTDLPRVCRSCRDYRPSADGQRGWCANAWAFTHSRLVHADEGVPCQSAIGDWWVPVDDVWLVAADVSAHGRATPLLDRLVAEETARRRRS